MTLIKLIRKYLIISMLIVLLTSCISHFFIFSFFIHYSADKMLVRQQEKIENYIAENDTLTLASTLVLKPPRIEQEEIEDITSYPEQQFRDTMMYSEEAGNLMPYRQLSFTTSYSGKYYLISLNTPTIISNDLLYAIVASLLILVVLFILFTYIIEFFLKRNIWTPLTENLQIINNYALQINTVPDLRSYNIQEFDEINEVILRMVQKINDDYNNSRIFIEDASHEMQTPLAIIRSKLDLFLQNEELMRDKAKQESVMTMLRSVSRLSKINKSLMLIHKINNNQYNDKKPVRLDKLLNLYLIDMEELFEAKGLVIHKDIHPCDIIMNPLLAEMLISNLLSNAFKYTVDNGLIEITLNPTELSIKNDCENENRLSDIFIRITTHNKRSGDSSGLGLNIVKTICDTNHFSVQYSYDEENKFRIWVNFLAN